MNEVNRPTQSKDPYEISRDETPGMSPGRLFLAHRI